MTEIKGVSPDAPIVTNERGGQQSKSEYAFHMIDPEAIMDLAATLQYGASRYARDNWRKIPAEEHINHMMIHWYAWLSGDKSDNHLGHMFCRAMMAYACAKAEERAKTLSPTMSDGRPRIVAVDFDGCLCKNAWPEIGNPNMDIIDKLIQHRISGGKAILWTCRENAALERAVAWCKELGLEFDAVNANLPEQTAFFGNDSRKLGADEYWDDKAVQVKADAE
jgi:hypothetical protein